MRTLSFQPDDRRFERIYAILVTGEPVKDRTQGKVHGAVCDKLERIGQVKEPVDANGEKREFKRDELRFYVTVLGGDVVLENNEYDFVKERCLAAFAGVHVSLTRDLESTVAWLESLPMQDAKAVPVAKSGAPVAAKS